MKIPFKDNKGWVIKLDDNLTIEDLVKKGITVHLKPRNTPLINGEYSHDPNEASKPKAEK